MSWQTTFNGNVKTSLAAALTSATVKLGPVASDDADPNTSTTIICSTQRAWNAAASPLTDRTYDVDLFLGVIVQGMDDADSIDDLWDALDTLEDAVWTLLAPGTFRNTNNIDAVTGVVAVPVTARKGQLRVTLRVRRD